MADARDETNPTADSVQTVNAEGVAPKRRMGTPSAAWGAYTQARNANIKRDARFADIAGINNGFPPTPPGVQERNGQGDLPNINTKQFQAKCKTYADNVTAITAKGSGWFEVEAEHDDPIQAEKNSKYLTECFNWALKKWDNTGFCNGNQYILETGARDMQMALFGIGIAFFPDPIDFRWKVIPTRRVLVPEGTRLCLDNCPAIFIEDQMSVTQLYGMRKKSGWNEAAILRNLYDRVEVMSQTAQRRWTYAEFVNSIRDNDQWLISDFQPVRIVHTFTMEFDGTISHSIFTDQYNLASNPMAKKEKSREYVEAGGFIYDKVKVAERWQQVWIPFADNAGPEGDYHGVKGFGDLIFDGCHLNNLMYNRAATAAIVQNLIMFEGEGENDVQKLDQVTLSNLGILPAGLRVSQAKFQGDIDAALSIFGTGTQIMDSNARLFPQNDKTDSGEQPTATQINFDRADQAQFTSQQIDLYRAVGLDVLGAEMYMRLAQPASKYPESWSGGKVAKEFREKCRDFGISEADLLKVKTVRANRNGGSGNIGVDVWKADQLMSIATPGAGQLNARKEKAAALKGWEMVGAYVEDAPQPGPSDQEISLENNLIQLGQAPEAFGWQDQEKHATSHLQLLAEGAQAAAQIQEIGIGPQSLEGAKKLSNFMAAGIQHTAQHVQLMASVPQTAKRMALHAQFVKEATRQLNNLQQLAQSLDEDIQKADQAQQPQMSPEMMKAQADIQIANMKAEADVARDDFKAKSKLGNQAVQVQARTEMKLGDHQVKTGIEQDRARQALENKAQQDALAIQTDAAKKALDLQATAAKDAIAVDTAKQKAEAAAKKPKPKK